MCNFSEYANIVQILTGPFRKQKHKPKWLSAEVIDSAITITEVELCAFWAPLNLACGLGWFRD